jgi:hypothetical protein
MASISGSVTIAGDPDDWIACAFDADTHAFAGAAAVSAGAYEITGLTAGKAYMVACRPKTGPAWTASQAYNDGDIIIPPDPQTTPYIFKGSVAVPYWSEVLLQSSFTGSNNGTTFVDEKGHTLTRAGTCVISTADYKWGASSLLTNTISLLRASGESDFRMGSSDFTLELWAKVNATHGVPSNGFSSLLAKYDNGNNQRSYDLALYNDGGTVKLYANLSTSGTGLTLQLTGTAITIGVWQHYALTREGNTFSLYIDGARVATNTMTGSLFDATSTALAICGRSTTTSVVAYGPNAYVDDVRVIKGTAAYSGATVSVPAAEFGVAKSSASEPTWPTTPADTVLDSGITWTNMGALVDAIMRGPVIAA